VTLAFHCLVRFAKQTVESRCVWSIGAVASHVSFQILRFAPARSLIVISYFRELSAVSHIERRSSGFGNWVKNFGNNWFTVTGAHDEGIDRAQGAGGGTQARIGDRRSVVRTFRHRTEVGIVSGIFRTSLHWFVSSVYAVDGVVARAWVDFVTVTSCISGAASCSSVGNELGFYNFVQG